MSSGVCFLVHSQDLGPEDCTANVSLSTGATTIVIPPGTVCVRCVIDGEVVDDAQFQIQGSNIQREICHPVSTYSELSIKSNCEVCIPMPTRKVQTREKIPKTPAVKNPTVSEKMKTELCVLCCQKVLDCKEDVIHCSGK